MCRSHYWRSIILTHFQIWRCTRLILTSPLEANSNSEEKRAKNSFIHILRSHQWRNTIFSHFRNWRCIRWILTSLSKAKRNNEKEKNGEKNSFIRMCRSHDLSSIQFYLQFEDHRISFKCFTTESYEDYFHIKVTNAQLRRFFLSGKNATKNVRVIKMVRKKES